MGRSNSDSVDVQASFASSDMRKARRKDTSPMEIVWFLSSSQIQASYQ